MATFQRTFQKTTGDTLNFLTNLQPHFPPSIFSFSKRRVSETMLKIHTSSPRGQISFQNMTGYGKVPFHLRGNKNQ